LFTIKKQGFQDFSNKTREHCFSWPKGIHFISDKPTYTRFSHLLGCKA